MFAFIFQHVAPPIFRELSTTLTAVTQSQVTLPCDFLPDPTITFFWRLSGQTIDVLDTESYSILDNGSLVILNVVVSDEGTYTCVAMNPLGTAQGNVVLDVQSKLIYTAIIIIAHTRTHTHECTQTHTHTQLYPQ